MCRQVKCRQCGKTTWAGCGEHVTEVMAGVASSERCSCGDASPSAGAPTGSAQGGFLGRLFRR